MIASLPLGIAACGAAAPPEPPAPDLAVVVDASANSIDLLPDPCESLPQSILMGIPDGGLPAPQINGNCWYLGPCSDYCPPFYSLCCTETPDGGGPQLFECIAYCGNAGRRPAGLIARLNSNSHSGCVVGHYFADAAHLEAASVRAFRDLARSLKQLGAPARLIAAARSAVRDEIRHARATAKLARAHGATPPPVELAHSNGEKPIHSNAKPVHLNLEALALENAVEGCVRETYGALVATWQARAAGDAEVRAALAPIARDETRHAELAWSLDAWAQPRLDRAARARVAEARARAVDELQSEVVEPPAALVAAAGVPTAARAREFIDAAAKELWRKSA